MKRADGMLYAARIDGGGLHLHQLSPSRTRRQQIAEIDTYGNRKGRLTVCLTRV
jgi:hypothetical protein